VPPLMVRLLRFQDHPQKAIFSPSCPPRHEGVGGFWVALQGNCQEAERRYSRVTGRIMFIFFFLVEKPGRAGQTQQIILGRGGFRAI